MANAARAIIIENGNILVMQRNKQGHQYFTLVGGRVNDNESLEQGLAREVEEETGMQVIASQLVFHEQHPAPYNEQYIYLCQVAPHSGGEIQKTSEEAMMNKLGIDTHKLHWISLNAFPKIAFRTPQLQTAIVNGIEHGFPRQPISI
jgi:ADP-ribose pyrophosphatase YjhB (NUDIX family)